MDYLIDHLHILAITKDNTKLNIFVDKYLLVDFGSNQEISWDLIKKNYSNLKYIHELLNHYDYNLDDNFYTLIDRFLGSIYQTTDRYLQSLTWDDSDLELTESFDYIKKKLCKSIQEKDFDKKIKSVLNAYNFLVPIIEDFLKEKYEFVVEEDFKNMFRPKRLKME
jgi:hypothetical protein